MEDKADTDKIKEASQPTENANNTPIISEKANLLSNQTPENTINDQKIEAKGDE